MKYKTSKWKKYKCVKPLTLKHLYLPPDEETIQQGELWWLTSDNKSKNIVTLEKVHSLSQKRCKITFECFREYFGEVTE